MSRFGPSRDNDAGLSDDGPMRRRLVLVGSVAALSLAVTAHATPAA